MVVGDEVLRPLVDSERAHEDEAPDACGLRCVQEVPCSLAHDPLELLGLALADRDEVHDALDALHRRGEARGLGHVTLHERAAGELGLRCSAQVTDEAPDLLAGATQGSHDVAADEPGGAGDENHPRGSWTRAGEVKPRLPNGSASPGAGVPEDERRGSRLCEEADRRDQLE